MWYSTVLRKLSFVSNLYIKRCIIYCIATCFVVTQKYIYIINKKVRVTNIKAI